MKHVLFKALACMLLLLALTLTVCACDNADTKDETTDDTTAAPTEAPTETPTEEPTEEETEEETEDSGLVTYKVTVVDASGAPVANVPVQLCQGELCRLPIPTGADGVALIEAEEDSYTAKALWNGGETESFSFNDSNELTIVLPE